MNDFTHWNIETADGIARITFDGVGALNMLNAQVLQELGDLAAWLRTAADVRAVVLSGAGRNFSAGIDPTIIRNMVGLERDLFAAHLSELQFCLDEFEEVPQPVIAAIRGFCIGGGMILGACCDFRYADRRAIFSLPEVKRGIGVIMGAARIARLCGMARAKEWILLGDRIRAGEALAGGYLNAVVEPDELETKAMAVARKLAALPADAVGLNKRILNEGQTLTIRESQKLEIALQGELLDSPDFRAAIEGFFADESG